MQALFGALEDDATVVVASKNTASDMQTGVMQTPCLQTLPVLLAAAGAGLRVL